MYVWRIATCSLGSAWSKGGSINALQEFESLATYGWREVYLLPTLASDFVCSGRDQLYPIDDMHLLLGPYHKLQTRLEKVRAGISSAWACGGFISDPALGRFWATQSGRSIWRHTLWRALLSSRRNQSKQRKAAMLSFSTSGCWKCWCWERFERTSEDGDDDEDETLSQSSYIFRAGRGARRYGIRLKSPNSDITSCGIESNLYACMAWQKSTAQMAWYWFCRLIPRPACFFIGVGRVAMYMGRIYRPSWAGGLSFSLKILL